MMRAAADSSVFLSRVFICGGLLAALFLPVPALTHPGDDARAEWLRGLQTPAGMSCCNQQDCQPTDAEMRDGQWWVPGGEAVPGDRVLTTPNLDGRAVVCRMPSGEIRCFVPPAGA